MSQLNDLKLRMEQMQSMNAHLTAQVALLEERAKEADTRAQGTIDYNSQCMQTILVSERALPYSLMTKRGSKHEPPKWKPFSFPTALSSS